MPVQLEICRGGTGTYRNRAKEGGYVTRLDAIRVTQYCVALKWPKLEMHLRIISIGFSHNEALQVGPSSGGPAMACQFN